MGQRLARIAQHVLLAAAFFFSLQYWMLKESLGVSLIWAVVAAAGAAWLGWRQERE